MKKLFLLPIFIGFFSSLAAQTTDEIEPKRPSILGGYAYVSISKPRTGDIYSVTNLLFLNSYIGKSWNENWIIGGQLGYNLQQQKGTTYDQNSSNIISFNNLTQTVSLGAFARYIINPKQTFGVFVEPKLIVERESTKTMRGGNTSSNLPEIKINAAVTLGIQYNLTPKYRLLARVGDAVYTYNQTYKNSFFSAYFLSYGVSLGIERKF
ncbi:MAG: hypothetical protein RL757_2781 [Bacteroidota bacterium]|jgi:hypothetical protein